MELKEIELKKKELMQQISSLNKLEHLKKMEQGLINIPPNKIHRKVRTVARAVLDLYDLLGEKPAEKNELVRVAEREI